MLGLSEFALPILRVAAPGVSGDLASYLQTVPGVASIGDRGGQLFIRGGTPSQTLTMIDGIRVYRPFHIIGFYSAFPAEATRNVDVHAVGYPARFGGRLGSVIDVEAQRGDTKYFDATVSVAPFLTGVQVSGPIIPNRATLLVSGRESLVDRVMPRWYRQGFPYGFGDQLAKLTINPGSGVSLGVTGFHTHDRGDVAGTRTDIFGNDIPLSEEETERYLIRWENAGAGGNLLIAPGRIPVRIDAHGSYSWSRNRVGSDDAVTRRSESKGWDARVTASRISRSLSMNLGGFYLQANHQYLQPGLSVLGIASPDSTGDHDYSEIGGFAEVQLRPSQNLLVTGGLRVLHIDPAQRLVAEPRARLVWTLPPTGIGRFTKEISLAAGIYHQGLLGLRDEREVGDVFTAYVPVSEGEVLPSAFHVVTGWQGTPGFGIRMAAEGYFKRFPDLLVPELSVLPEPSLSFERAEATAYGMDLRADGSRPFWSGTTLTAAIGYGFGRVEMKTATETFRPSYDRRHQLSLVSRLEKGGYALSMQWHYGSGYPFTQSAGFDDWILLDDPDVDVSSDPGVVRGLYGERNGAELPAYHRIDVYGERRIEHPAYLITLRAGLVNAYNRHNLFYFDLFTFRRVDQLPILPTIGIKIQTR